MQEVFGEFVNIDPAADGVLDLSFSVHRDAVDEDWRKNDICACFVADYTGRTAEETGLDGAISIPELCDRVNYVANEMLESAMRAHAGDAGHICIKVRLNDNDLRLYVVSECAPDTLKTLRQQANDILASDPNALYFDRLSQPPQIEEAAHPDIGYLSMMVDYDAALAWKIEAAGREGDTVSVTTMTAMRM